MTMGLQQWIKAQFDRGGIGMKLELPRDFKWSDGEIPLAVVLSGHKNDSRIVKGLRFTISDDEESRDSEQRSGARVCHVWDREGPVQLGATEQMRLEVTMPLPGEETREEIEQRAFGRAASGFAEKAFLAVAGGVPPGSVSRYLVTVEGDVEGANKPKRASKHIRQRKGPTFGIGGVSVQL